MKAIVKRVTHGKLKGQFRFILKGVNGEIVATGETYTEKHSCLETLQSCFPNFEVVDTTQ